MHVRIVLIATLTLGCAMGEGTATRFTATDSAGVRLQVSSAPQWDEGAGWQLAAEPALQIGALDGPPEYLFDRIGDVLRLHDGSILVVNHGSRELRIYDAAGTHVRTMGGRGEGPGEFERIANVLAHTDSLFVFDHGLYRISTLGTDGALRGMTTLAAEGRALRTYRLADVVSDGFVMIARGGFRGFLGTGGLRRDSVPSLLYATSGELRDTVAAFAVSDIFERPRGMVGSPFFGAESSGIADGETVYMTDGGSMEVRVHALDGALRRVLRIVEEPQPVTDADKALVLERRFSRVPDVPQELRREIEQVPYRPTMPRISGLLLDDEGNLWVDEYRENSDTTSHVSYVFAPDGRWLGTVQMPPHFELRTVRQGQALGVWEDPNSEVQFVRAYAIKR